MAQATLYLWRLTLRDITLWFWYFSPHRYTLLLLLSIELCCVAVGVRLAVCALFAHFFIFILPPCFDFTHICTYSSIIGMCVAPGLVYHFAFYWRREAPINASSTMRLRSCLQQKTVLFLWASFDFFSSRCCLAKYIVFDHMMGLHCKSKRSGDACMHGRTVGSLNL